MPDTSIKIQTEGTLTLVGATETVLAGGDGSQGILQIVNNTGAALYIVHAVTGGAVALAVSATAGTYHRSLAADEYGEFSYGSNAAIYGYSAGGGDVLRTVVAQRSY